MKAKNSALFATGLLLTATLSTASLSFGDESDHERARQALLAGEILPLRTVLDRIEQSYPGQPVKIEFEEDDGIYLYEIKLLQDDGNMIKLKVDGKDARIIDIKRRHNKSKEDD